MKRMNTFVETVHFKMEGIHMLKDTLNPGDRLTNIDLKDAYIMILNGTTPQMSTEIPVAGEKLRIQLSPLWTIIRTLGLYQDHNASNCQTPVPRTESDNIHRRHTDYGQLTHGGEETCTRFNIPARESGVHHKSPQVYLSTNTGDNIPGLYNQLHQDGNSNTWRKIKHIRQNTKKLLDTQYPHTLVLYRLQGKLNHATQGIPPAPLIYRNLQLCL